MARALKKGTHGDLDKKTQAQTQKQTDNLIDKGTDGNLNMIT